MFQTGNIAILLATYNGEKYIKEQLDSLLSQTYQDWHLYVHDDGSWDGTVAILNSFASAHPGMVTILDYPPTGGPCSNFLSMLSRVEACYYMFCDQDDVWLPGKIELSLGKLRQMEQEHPYKAVAVYTDLQIVDENLVPLSASMWEHAGIYPQYIRTFADCGGHTAIATGCTMMLNDEAKKCCLFPADKAAAKREQSDARISSAERKRTRTKSKALMHDIWVCLCVLKCGGVLKGIDEKTVLYRQHGNNTLGAKGAKAADIGLRYRLLNLKKVYRSNRGYYAMLFSLGYGSVMKYLYNKMKFKMRVRRGYY